MCQKFDPTQDILDEEETPKSETEPSKTLTAEEIQHLIDTCV